MSDVFRNFVDRLGNRVARSGDRSVTFRCPAHDDRNASASASIGSDGRVLVWCFRSCSAEDICGALGLELKDLFPCSTQRQLQQRPSPSTTNVKDHKGCAVKWGPERARFLWRHALETARDDRFVEENRDVWDYLAGRGLMEAWEDGAFGVLHPAHLPKGLPRDVRNWPRDGYRIVAPLFDENGDVVEVQARNIRPDAKRRVLSAKGSRISRRLFASAAGRMLLAGEFDHDSVVFGEGLTDSLALTITAPVPVLASPGVGAARKGIGTWARGRCVLLALDCDQAGDRTVDSAAEAVHKAGGIPFRLRWPGDCKDACDVIERFGSSGLAEFLRAAITRSKAA